VRGAHHVSQLSHREYDVLERALSRGSRVAIARSGRREIVVMPLSLRVASGREVITARNPTTGHEMTIYLDEVERIEAVGREETGDGGRRPGA
jgi:hypothetical protein